MNWLKAKLDARRAVSNEGSRDSELLERLRRQDDQAFLVLYDQYGPSVYRYLIGMSGSLEVAEELTQQAFVLILEQLSASKPLQHFNSAKGTLEGYLIGIARNLLRSESRRSLRQTSLESTSEEGNDANVQREESPLDTLEKHDDLDLLQKLVSELPSHYRDALVLCDLQEKSYKEVAKILRCSEGTVASRLNRARKLLRAKFDIALRAGTREQSDEKKGGFYERAYFLKD